MGLLQEIQNDVTSSETGGEITNVLRKCKRLAARLGSDDLARWVDSELNGYQEAQPIPDYRRLKGNCYANFMNGRWRANHQVVPVFAVPEEFRDDFYRVEFRDGVAKALPFVGKGAKIEQPHLPMLIQREGVMFPRLQCVTAWMEISGGEFEQLVSALKNRILDFVLKIEAENPDAGEALPNTHPVPTEALQPLVQNTFYGPVGNVAQHSEHFNQTASMEIKPQDVSKFVTELTAHIDELNLDARQRQRVEAQIAILNAELAGDQIHKSSGRLGARCGALQKVRSAAC
jgi:hypothetical protein